ncbi:hypothetical protein SAMN02745248_02228 [Hathewaya proteolytica DSM 3090]|uniref:DUF1287 domain-containing protein n=1 Tax=Hathewaya proteolytica DSM 3090 TaxID=1121331 RepID=A0A1M6R9U7_9CLOT|nr:DUF1287 domain-containing protein [Hathewaya proteolytica]SHK29231.1 hypothetical protein SAMN02745248_02228 [Hathewaya proteolytica DSM 3090]
MRKKKTVLKVSLLIVTTVFLSGVIFAMCFRDGLIMDWIGIHAELPFGKKVNIGIINEDVDNNKNGISDPIDIVNAARQEVKNKTTYKSAYYVGGYPPNNEGVCTDVVWRAYKGIGVSLKDLMDKDIAENTELYPRVHGKPDPNIDFRRVVNQLVYFERHFENLPVEIDVKDIENLKQFQPGDIIVYTDGYEHVGIVSDRRSRSGIPYIIHNGGPVPSEIKLTSIKIPIRGHFRWSF